jgi:hypothetical protein
VTGRPTRRAVARVSAVVASVAIAVCLIVGLTAGFPKHSPPVPAASATGLAVPKVVAPLAPLVIPAVLNYCPLVDAVHEEVDYTLPVDRVYICRGDVRHDTDGVSTYGPWETAYRVLDPDALLAAYRAPNAPASGGYCANRYQDPLIIWVHHDGVTSAYYAPVDGCGDPSAAAQRAYTAAKRLTLVAVDRGAPTVSKKDAKG